MKYAYLFMIALLAGCLRVSPVVTVPVPDSDQLLYWCKQEDQWPVYESPPEDCEDVSRGEWSHYPVIVNAEPGAAGATLEAIEAINEQVGLEMFRLSTANVHPDVWVVVLDDSFFLAGQALRYTEDGVDRGAVAIFGERYQDRADLMMHELGHLLGLRHDHGSKLSVMYPSLGPRVASLEKQDVKVLRQMYYSAYKPRH